LQGRDARRQRAAVLVVEVPERVVADLGLEALASRVEFGGRFPREPALLHRGDCVTQLAQTGERAPGRERARPPAATVTAPATAPPRPSPSEGGRWRGRGAARGLPVRPSPSPPALAARWLRRRPGAARRRQDRLSERAERLFDPHRPAGAARRRTTPVTARLPSWPIVSLVRPRGRSRLRPDARGEGRRRRRRSLIRAPAAATRLSPAGPPTRPPRRGSRPASPRRPSGPWRPQSAPAPPSGPVLAVEGGPRRLPASVWAVDSVPAARATSANIRRASARSAANAEA